MAETQTKLPIKTDTKAGMSAASGTSASASAPWQPFESLRREIDSIFENFGLGSWRLPAERAPRLAMGWPGAIAPATDLTERDGEYEITAELPGLDQKDVEVKLANGMLTIKGEKREEREEGDKDYHLSERRYGSFMRAFAMPPGVDADKIEANFTKGVLTVKLPKTAEARQKEKKIDVKAA